MFTTLLPELRPYLEQLLADGLAHTEMTIRHQATRERLLSMLENEFVHFIFVQFMAALPPNARGQFVFLLEEGASEEKLATFTRCSIADIPAFVVQVFNKFRSRYVPATDPSYNEEQEDMPLVPFSQCSSLSLTTLMSQGHSTHD